MSFSARNTLPVLLTLFSLAISVSSQTTTKPTAKAPRGSVSGRVTIKDKGAAGIPVGLRKSDTFMPYESFNKTITDHDGYYRIFNLAPGSYEVIPSAPAFVTSEANQRGKTVIVGDDENVDGINFSLVRGGVITGKVTDAEGRPLVMQAVYLYRADLPEQQPGVPRPLFSLSSVWTDDRGIYRMYGLSAGKYKVAAGRSDDTAGGTFAVTRSIYHRVFHPDTTEQAKATVIEVREGSEASNVDITLGRAMQTFSVSGRVVDGEKGTPVPNVRFGLQRVIGQRIEMVPAQITSNPLGEFFVDGVVPGKYGFSLFQTMTGSALPDMRVESFSFDVVDQDVTGVSVRLVRGASLSGVAILESDDKAVQQRFHQMQLRAFVMSQGAPGYGQSSSSPIGPDGSFRLGGLGGGTASIFLSSVAGPTETRGFVISRVERDGMPQPRRTVEVKEGEHVTGLRLVFSYGTAKIRGVLKFENGTMPPNSQISVRLLKPGETFFNISPPQVDARGHFLIEGVPPGVYELRVLLSSGGPTPGRSVKQEVSVQDGVITDVVVTIDLGPTPK